MIQAELETLIEPLLTNLGYVLWGSDYRREGKGVFFRLYIDKATGVGIEDCERVSRAVSALLDVEDPIAGHYTLEISSPGLPRPLFKLSQYQANLGQAVMLKLGHPIHGTRKIVGQIQSVTGNQVTIQGVNHLFEVPFSSIMKAHLRVGEVTNE